MRVPAKFTFLCVALCLCAAAVHADEIRLKDGKKLYGVIVAYEDNMFKVKTDYGFVLVEKDKIASIVPSTPANAPASAAVPASSAATPAKSAAGKPATESASNSAPSANNSEPAPPKAKISADPIKPSLPAANASTKITAPAVKSSAPPPNSVAAATQAPAAPKEPELPAMKEVIQGNLYTNFSHGFKMYKAPSWDLIADARQALPNAIVAMGTSNESTLMVIGQEPFKDSLDASANAVEKKLREIYANYHLLSRRKSVVGGSPAVEFKYTGTAEEHEWSGTLVVVAREKEVLTILGMTYADNDLIQIQENVIARAIASTEFNVH
jgi:hypothetical protein